MCLEVKCHEKVSKKANNRCSRCGHRYTAMPIDTHAAVLAMVGETAANAIGNSIGGEQTKLAANHF